MGREIYVIFFKKMACKTRALPMEGDYEKNRPKKRGEGGNITLIKNPAREKKNPPVKILRIPPVKKKFPPVKIYQILPVKIVNCP